MPTDFPVALSVQDTFQDTRNQSEHEAAFWIGDEFHGDNAGLLITKVELMRSPAAGRTSLLDREGGVR
jgi:CYTH domain-containing protein